MENNPSLGATNISGVTIKSPVELQYMKQAGEVVRKTKEIIKEAIDSGVSTSDLDRIAEKEIRKQGAVPSFKGLYGFPATICTSINHEIVHGIPSVKRVLKTGDIISVDVGAVVGGFHADSAFTVSIGEVDERVRKLITDTYESLKCGIEQAVPEGRIGDISAAVQRYAEDRGYGVVRQYVGHGIGRALHEDPQVPNYGEHGKGMKLREGMTIAIEPMLNLGTWKTQVEDDGWTVVTADGRLSAHFEDTVAITNNGPEVLT